MRFPTLPNLIRTFTLTNITTATFRNPAAALHRAPLALTRGTNPTTLFRSMPTIPFLASFFSSQPKDMTDYPVRKSEDEWQAVLSPEQFRVIREKGTEAPYTGEYDKHMPSAGTYECAACHAPLYRATHKFKSGCGWPAYFDSLPGAVTRHTDSTLGMARTEITCSRCGGHLGHVFKGEGYPTPTDERHCVNSVSLKFAKEEDGEGK
ncbi:MAG: Peptide methionine sulfoxide reductase B2, chloroplastic [Alectoria fallacina]|uniref:Peptide-methionine (R)-S-oxide reductase n=1 Tax=Alectoria fallacina TaxID=1903189 RepID=A0A8H3EQK2_9LECA|nr:MAG: Peptide methionine sulfoxide reductase B2, chloroplastic [Alectoria fallacina]